MAPPSLRAQHKINQWAARIVPALLIGLVGFVTWVMIVLIGVKYLIQPPHSARGAGIAIIVLDSILLLLMSTSYLRVLQVVTTNPGLVPLPSTAQQDDFLDRGAILAERHLAPNGLEQYYNRDVFECDLDGLPRWCSTCKTWKPDRSHHSSEIGRCVYKMDHFCPWAGGIISETTYKFFVQFCIYTMLYCAFTLVVAAYYTAQLHHSSNTYHATWIIVIACAGLFWLFTSGMVYTSLLAVHQNLTTVDNFTRANRIYHLAVLIPDSYPLENIQPRRRASVDAREEMNGSIDPAKSPFSTITYPLQDTKTEGQANQQQLLRRFAILPCPQGSNPYLLSSATANWKSVFGNRWYDWFLPLKYSPCCNHRYEYGPVLEKMKKEADLH